MKKEFFKTNGLFFFEREYNKSIKDYLKTKKKIIIITKTLRYY